MDYFSSFRYITIVMFLAALISLSTYSSISRVRSEATSFLDLITRATPSIITLITYIGSILGVSLGFDSINRERKEGTLLAVLSCPVYRDSVIVGKFISGAISIMVSILLANLLASGLIIAFTGISLSLDEAYRFLAFILLSFTYVLGYYAISMLFSVLIDEVSVSLLASVIFWMINAYIVPSISWTIAEMMSLENIEYRRVIRASILMFSVNEHYRAVSICLLNPRAAYRLMPITIWSIPIKPLSLMETLMTTWPSIVTLVAITIICTVMAYIAFTSREIF